MVVYGAACLGWLAIWLTPQITSVIFNVRADIRVKKLEISQKKLVEEWGEQVKAGIHQIEQ